MYFVYNTLHTGADTHVGTLHSAGGLHFTTTENERPQQQQQQQLGKCFSSTSLFPLLFHFPLSCADTWAPHPPKKQKKNSRAKKRKTFPDNKIHKSGSFHREKQEKEEEKESVSCAREKARVMRGELAKKVPSILGAP